jgi:hypothetical protein
MKEHHGPMDFPGSALNHTTPPLIWLPTSWAVVNTGFGTTGGPISWVLDNPWVIFPLGVTLCVDVLLALVILSMEPSRPPQALDRYANQLHTRLPLAPALLLALYVRWAPWFALNFGAVSLLFVAAVSPFLAIVIFGLLVAGEFGALAVAFLMLTLLGTGSMVDALGGYDMRRRRGSGWWLVAAATALGLLNLVLAAALVLLVHWWGLASWLDWLNWLQGGILLGLLVHVLVGYLHLQVKPSFGQGRPAATPTASFR